MLLDRDAAGRRKINTSEPLNIKKSITIREPASGGRSGTRGFALVVTLVLMVLLGILALGMLSLSSISLRASGIAGDRARAEANARLGLMLALGKLQKLAGPDQRVSADGSLNGAAVKAPEAVGIWESWSPDFVAAPDKAAPDYAAAKSSRFLGWLVSNGDEAPLKSREWPDEGTLGDAVEIFQEAKDGFSHSGGKVKVAGKEAGAYAWAVVQESTKAKINVGGQTPAWAEKNDALAAQPRPSASSGGAFAEPPSGGWDERAVKVTDFRQAELDVQLWKGAVSTAAGKDFTTQGFGLLTDVVDGGLKVDLSLGFELTDGDFAQTLWTVGGETLKNPFVAAAETGFIVPSDYGSQRPLYRPLSTKGTQREKFDFSPVKVEFDFPVTSVPTFDLLRSYYRTTRHLYKTAEGITVFEREADHIAANPQAMSAGWFPPPGKSMGGAVTKPAIRPVMDRIMFLVSAAKGEDDVLQFVFTPMVTLWNPYNVALEIEGAVTYIWADIPYRIGWKVFDASGVQKFDQNVPVSWIMGAQFAPESRSVDPYFHVAMTATGSPLGTSGVNPVIRFKPGEVRVFAPAQQTLKKYNKTGSVRERTVFLKPVDNLAQYSTEGGLIVPTYDTLGSRGYTRKMEQTEKAEMNMFASKNSDYPFFISMEDATRAKGANPTNADRGTLIADILTKQFTQSGETIEFKSPRLTFSELDTPQPVGVLETYHRVARSGAGSQFADLVFTGNPRQPWMNPLMATGTTFVTGPQYQVRMRKVSSFNGALETGSSGRNAFYGATQTALMGRTELSFFGLPTDTLLSLAEFQHLDMSQTPFSPANAFANSWASAYVPRAKVAASTLRVDHAYLANEALWDGFFFSGAAPRFELKPGSGSPSVWGSQQADTSRSLAATVEGFVDNPLTSPLGNTRIRLHRGTATDAELKDLFQSPQGCVKAAGHLFVDGAFNVNSTRVEAWKALLSGLRNTALEKQDGSALVSSGTVFPRFRTPVGTANDIWNGYRDLTDSQITSVAEKLVDEIRKRGPFLSLSEFVNRRVTDGPLGLAGAVQAAIDASGVNAGAIQEAFVPANYPADSKDNIVPPNTGVGVPGYLTQADLLKSIAPVISVRGDTFTIRSYGEARDGKGAVTASVVLEATVQRLPEYVDAGNKPYTPRSDLNLSAANQAFGRRFGIISLRTVSSKEFSNLL